MPLLKIVSPKIALEAEIDEGRALSIGRHIGNSLPIPDTEISRRHAQIFPRDGRMFVSDLGSRNGVYVNGEQVREAELNAGDEIALGMSLILFDPPQNAKLPDTLSPRSALLWEKIPAHKRFQPFVVTTFSRVELDQMIAKWLDRTGGVPQIPASFASRSLGFALSLDQPANASKLCQAAADFLRDRLGAERIAIMRADPKKKELAAQYLHDAGGTGGFDVGKDVLRVAVDAEDAVYCPDCRADFRFTRMFKQSEEVVGSFLAAPIFVREAYYGFIYMDQPPGTRQYDFRAMIQAYLAGALLGKCIHWYGMARSERAGKGR